MANNITSHTNILELAKANNLDLPEPYLTEMIDAYEHVNTMLKRFRSCQTAANGMEYVFVPVAAEKEGET